MAQPNVGVIYGILNVRTQNGFCVPVTTWKGMYRADLSLFFRKTGEIAPRQKVNLPVMVDGVPTTITAISGLMPGVFFYKKPSGGSNMSRICLQPGVSTIRYA